MYVKVDWYRSRPFAIDLDETSVVELLVVVPSGTLLSWHDMILTPSCYFELVRKRSEGVSASKIRGGSANQHSQEMNPESYAISTPQSAKEPQTKTSADAKFRVFQCSRCHEYVNTTLTECRFCHTPINAEAAQAAEEQAGETA